MSAVVTTVLSVKRWWRHNPYLQGTYNLIEELIWCVHLCVEVGSYGRVYVE